MITKDKNGERIFVNQHPPQIINEWNSLQLDDIGMLQLPHYLQFSVLESLVLEHLQLHFIIQRNKQLHMSFTN